LSLFFTCLATHSPTPLPKRKSDIRQDYPSSEEHPARNLRLGAGQRCPAVLLSSFMVASATFFFFAGWAPSRAPGRPGFEAGRGRRLLEVTYKYTRGTPACETLRAPYPFSGCGKAGKSRSVRLRRPLRRTPTSQSFFFSRLIRARGGRVGKASPPCPPPDTGLSIRPAYPFLPPSKFLRGRGGARGEWVAPREELRPVGGLRPPDSGPRSCRKVAAGRGPVRRRPGPRTPRVGLSRAANLRPAAVH